MKAVITRNISETIECGHGIIKTFYIMLGGRKDPETIKEMFITDNDYLFEPLKVFESINKSSKQIKNEDLKSTSFSEIKLYLEVVQNILFYSYDLLNDAKASLQDQNFGDPPEEYVFLSRMDYTHWGMCILELSKLFTNSRFQEFNIYSLLDIVDNFKNAVDAPVKIKSINTQKYRDALRLYEDEKILENLKTIRDKVFAHTDKDFYTRTSGIELDYTNLERLQSTTFEILKELNERLLNHALEEYKPNTAVKSILSLLSKEIKGIKD